jgi:membrane fusion protein, multidrug efflux system
MTPRLASKRAVNRSARNDGSQFGNAVRPERSAAEGGAKSKGSTPVLRLRARCAGATLSTNGCCSTNARLAVLACLAAAVACSPAGDRAAPGPRPVQVRAAPAAEKDVPVELRAVGRIEANRSVSIRAQVSGAIVAVHFTEGAQVKEGQLLLEIDRRPHAAALAEAKARLAQDRARAENARADAVRYADLVEKEFVTRQQYEAARANAAALEASVGADQAAVDRAALNLAFCSIRAPVAGRTGRLLVQAGNLVSANGPEPLLTLEQVQPVFATFSVPEQHVTALRARSGAPLEVRVTPSGGNPVTGPLTFMDNAVDPTTGTILLKARLANDDERLWPGQVVEVALRIAEWTRAVVVPSSAVASGQQGDYAYVVTADNKVQLRPVEVAQAGEAETVIAKGIAAGELVVTEGQLRLRPDVLVEVMKAGGGAGAVAAPGPAAGGPPGTGGKAR